MGVMSFGNKCRKYISLFFNFFWPFSRKFYRLVLIYQWPPQREVEMVFFHCQLRGRKTTLDKIEPGGGFTLDLGTILLVLVFNESKNVRDKMGIYV